MLLLLNKTMLRLRETRNHLTVVLAIAPVLGVLAGLRYYAPEFPVYWTAGVLHDFLIWTAACLGIAWLLRRNAPTQAHRLFAVAISVYLAIGVGLDATAAVALLLVSSFLWGRGSLRLIFEGGSDAANWSLCVFLGLAVQLAIFGVLIHFPLNFRAFYVAILSAPILALLLSGGLQRGWRGFVNGVAIRTRTFDEIPYWYFVLLMILLGAVARYALYPTVGYDENALHLRMWTQLTYRHVYEFDVVTQVWEVAPFAVALLHAIVSLVAGDDARGALTLALTLLLCAQIWAILAHFSLKRHDRLLMLVLFGSTPMLGSLLGALQAELFLALMMAGGVRFALEARDGWLGSRMLVVLTIAAMCVAAKLPGALIGILLVGAAALQVSLSRSLGHPPQRLRSPALLILFLLLLISMALHAYVTAWRITGNPFFPLYNGIFKSPYFEAANFADTRWLKGFSLESYWGLFFKTSGFQESKDFVAGFQYLFLPFIALLAVGRTDLRKLWIVLIPLAGFGVIMFAMIQYWRYLFPALPLATVIISALLWEKHGGQEWQRAVARVAILACVAINLYFFPGVSWVFEGPPQQAYTAAGRRAIAERINPAKLLTAYVNERYPGATVLYPASTPFGADLKGDPVLVNWYSPSHQARFAAATSLTHVANFVKDEKVGFVIWSTYDAPTPEHPEWFLREYLSQAGYPELRIGNFTLYRVVGHDLAYREAFDLRKQISGEVKIAKDDPSAAMPVTVPTSGATRLRYHVTYRCQSATGRLVALIQWGTGSPYYRLMPCSETPLSFSESLPVPDGASRAQMQFTRQDTAEAELTDIRLEMN
ncbi:hypothetical protein [Cupriavidus sp. CP313]